MSSTSRGRVSTAGAIVGRSSGGVDDGRLAGAAPKERERIVADLAARVQLLKQEIAQLRAHVESLAQRAPQH